MNLKINNPSGICDRFEQHQGLIEKIGSIKSLQHKSISYYDGDDINQEVFIKCWQAVEKYDPNCDTKLRVFLSVCAENRIIDIRRGLVYRHNKTCCQLNAKPVTVYTPTLCYMSMGTKMKIATKRKFSCPAKINWTKDRFNRVHINLCISNSTSINTKPTIQDNHPLHTDVIIKNLLRIFPVNIYAATVSAK